MTTTIYLPMPEWQALHFLRNRGDAFSRLLTPAGNHLPCEVVLMDDSLFGFRNRENAVEIGKRVYPHGFAVLRFVVNGKVLNSMMSLQRQITSETDTTSGAQLYRINRSGLETVSQRCDGPDVEIMVDQIFGTCEHQHDHDRDVHTQGSPDHGLLEDGGRPVFCGSGPTGFGC